MKVSQILGGGALALLTFGFTSCDSNNTIDGDDQGQNGNGTGVHVDSLSRRCHGWCAPLGVTAKRAVWSDYDKRSTIIAMP